MNSTIKIATFLAFITTALFFISNEFLGGYLSEANNKIGDEISAPAQSLYEWNLAEKAPFKYRILFPAIIKGTWKLLANHQQDNTTFIIVYKLWSLVFLITSVVTFFFLIRATGFDNRWSLLGCFLFLFSPPVLLAYTLPVHTREDTLGYTLLGLGLICILKNRILLFLFISVLGILCRETLLLLPFVFLCFSRYTNFFTRAVIAAIPAVLWITLRIFINSGNYDLWEGLRWNLNNIEQVIGFSFITFGFMWILFFYGIINKPQLIDHHRRLPIHLFYRSGLSVFLLVVITTCLGGIVNEIRLLFLLFPWVIILSLHLLYKERTYFVSLVKNKRFIIFSIVNTLIFGILCVYLVNNYQLFFEYSSFDIRFDVWIVVTVFSLLVTMLFIPAYIKIWNGHLPLVSRYAKHH